MNSRRAIEKTAGRLLLSAAFAFFAGGAFAAEPVVVVEPTKLSVTGVTPGTEVLVFGIGLQPKGYHVVVRRWSTVVSDSDHDGAVNFALDPPITWNTLWVIADLRTGKYVIASTPGFPVARAWLPRRDLRRGSDGTVARLLYERSTADVLYLVPGGAWTLHLADGEPSDGDGTPDGAISVEIERLAGVLPATPPPRALTPGGTLLLIDQSRLDLLELKLDAELLAGAQ
jgi:hypothetical protein